MMPSCCEAARYEMVGAAFPDLGGRPDATDVGSQCHPLLRSTTDTPKRSEVETRDRVMQIPHSSAPALSRFRDMPRLAAYPVAEDLADRPGDTPDHPHPIDATIDDMVVSLCADQGGHRE
jgi:hypothetical protein